MTSKLTALILFTGLLFASQSAHAYIDPGSSSAILSAIVGFFVAVTMAIKTYWYKLKSFFRGTEPPVEASVEETPEEVSPDANDKA